MPKGCLPYNRKSRRWAASLVAGLLAAAGMGTAGIVHSAEEPALPERLEMAPPAAALPTPEALIEEARQAAARVTRPTYGIGVGKLLQDLRTAMALHRLLAAVDGGHWPHQAVPSPPDEGPGFLDEGRAARTRCLELITALAAEDPAQAVSLVDRLAGEVDADDISLRSTVAYYAALGAVARDPLQAGALATAVRDETRRGMVWDQIGRAWLRRGSW